MVYTSTDQVINESLFCQSTMFWFITSYWPCPFLINICVFDRLLHFAFLCSSFCTFTVVNNGLLLMFVFFFLLVLLFVGCFEIFRVHVSHCHCVVCVGVHACTMCFCV